MSVRACAVRTISRRISRFCESISVPLVGKVISIGMWTHCSAQGGACWTTGWGGGACCGGGDSEPPHAIANSPVSASAHPIHRFVIASSSSPRPNGPSHPRVLEREPGFQSFPQPSDPSTTVAGSASSSLALSAGTLERAMAPSTTVASCSPEREGELVDRS